MKRYAFLRLENNANKVIFETVAANVKDAAQQFNRSLKNIQLDEYGYGKLGEVTYCVAEFYEPFYSV